LGDRNIAHGKLGFPILFVDGHCEYVVYRRLNKTQPFGEYNLDWTIGGLAKGEDLVR
jgi:prepilin-type processing-associated H-X9-DG protein